MPDYHWELWDTDTNFYLQVNLDFSSESDMIKKFRAGLALQPVGTYFLPCKIFLLVGSSATD